MRQTKVRRTPNGQAPLCGGAVDVVVIRSVDAAFEMRRGAAAFEVRIDRIVKLKVLQGKIEAAMRRRRENEYSG